MKEEEEEYKKSEKYAEWEKQYNEREDDDIFKYDPDPEGWQKLFETVDLKQEKGLTVATLVSQANPSEAEVQVKSLKMFLKYNKSDLALKAAHNLLTHNPTYYKTERMLKLFSEYSKTAQFAKKEDLTSFNDLQKKQVKLDPKAASKDMVHAHELLK